MRTYALAALLLAAVPSAGIAAPCVPGSLAGYIALGAGGCTIGDATFASFTSGAAPLAIEIDPQFIFVDPLDGAGSVGVTFQLIGAAAAGEVKGNGIGYSVSGPTLVGRELALGGTMVVPDGVVTAVQFAPDPLIVFDIGDDADLFESQALVPGTFFDIFTEITLDGGLAGFAGLDVEVTENFRIPEPASLAVVGLGLAAVGWRRRRRQSLA